MIDQGDRLPDFELPDQDGETVTFDDVKGPAGLVLYVYPKDDTPGCTIEAQDFQRHLAAFRDAGWGVAGLSRDDAGSHCRFAEKYGLHFPLLTDADAGWLRAVDAWGEKTFYGKTSEGILRTTLVADSEGKLRHVYRNVRANGHVERVMGDLGIEA